MSILKVILLLNPHEKKQGLLLQMWNTRTTIEDEEIKKNWDAVIVRQYPQNIIKEVVGDVYLYITHHSFSPAMSEPGGNRP